MVLRIATLVAGLAILEFRVPSSEFRLPLLLIAGRVWHCVV